MIGCNCGYPGDLFLSLIRNRLNGCPDQSGKSGKDEPLQPLKIRLKSFW